MSISVTWQLKEKKTAIFAAQPDTTIMQLLISSLRGTLCLSFPSGVSVATVKEAIWQKEGIVQGKSGFCVHFTSDSTRSPYR